MSSCEFTRAQNPVFSGKVVPGIAEVGSVFLRFRGSIWKVVGQTEARARLAFQNAKKMSRSEHFWKMRSAECARDCSESMRELGFT